MALVRVEIVPDVLLTCTTHALTTETEEVMGLLLGNIRWENGAAISRIWRVMPQIRTDRRKDRVEPSHEQLSYCIGVADKLTHMTGVDTKIVGWYHSHPNITVQPSHVDLKTQAQHQALDEGFVGLIFSCFNKDQKLHCTAFQSTPGGEEAEVSAISVEHEDPDIRKALQMSLEDSRQGQAISSSNWKHKEVPLVVSKPDGEWERSSTDMVQLQKMLFFEEKQGYDEAMESSTSSSLAPLHHGSVYLQSLARLMDTVLVPALNTVKQTIAQNELHVAQLDAELKSARATSKGTGVPNYLEDAEERLAEKAAKMSLNTGHQNATTHVLDRVTEAEYLMNVGRMENTRYDAPQSQAPSETPVVASAPGWGNGSAGPPPGFAQPQVHPPILGLDIDPPIGRGSMDLERERVVMGLQKPIGTRIEDARATLSFGGHPQSGHITSGSDFSQTSSPFPQASASSMFARQPSGFEQNAAQQRNPVVSSHVLGSEDKSWGSVGDRGRGASSIGAGVLGVDFNAGLMGNRNLGSISMDRVMPDHPTASPSNGPISLGQSIAPQVQAQSHAPGVYGQPAPFISTQVLEGVVPSQRQPTATGPSNAMTSQRFGTYPEQDTGHSFGMGSPFVELDPIGQMSNGLSGRGRSAGSSTTPGHHWHPGQSHDPRFGSVGGNMAGSGTTVPSMSSYGQVPAQSISSPSTDVGMRWEKSRDAFGGRMPVTGGDGRRGGRGGYVGRGGLQSRRSYRGRGSGHGGDSKKFKDGVDPNSDRRK
ncbi:hypothetical protein BSKO_00464 [Bryopsis sp. KO-2023]|nr:hypothetical protein BSKO_00464 [Bryopsis sp. KO-2023]